MNEGFIHPSALILRSLHEGSGWVVPIRCPEPTSQGEEDDLPFPFSLEAEEGKVEKVFDDASERRYSMDDEDDRHGLPRTDPIEDEWDQALVMSEKDSSLPRC